MQPLLKTPEALEPLPAQVQRWLAGNASRVAVYREMATQVRQRRAEVGCSGRDGECYCRDGERGAGRAACRVQLLRAGTDCAARTRWLAWPAPAALRR
jgi:hypothetical protein